MALTFPHEHVSKAINASARNYDTIMSLKKRDPSSAEKVATEVALTSFDEMQNAYLGVGHYVKKYASGALAHLTIMGAPAAALMGGLYLAKDKWVDIAILGAGTTVAAGAFDMASNWVVRVKPITLALAAAWESWRYFASRTSDGWIQSYTRMEDKCIETQKRCHETIVTQLKTTWEDVANELLSRFNKVQNDPKGLYDLKQEVQKLAGLLPEVDKIFARLSLSGAESSNVLDKLKNMMRFIDEQKIAVRSGTSDESKQYNMILMSQIPESYFKDMGTSVIVDKCVEEINQNRLGVMHTAKSYFVSGVSGLATAAATIPAFAALGALADADTYDSTFGKAVKYGTDRAIDANWVPVAATAAVVIPVAALAGASVTKHVIAGYHQERKDHDLIVNENTKIAVVDLSTIYDGLAKTLRASPRSSETQKQALAIQAKLPLIHAQIEKTGLDVASEDITAELQKAIKEVLSN